MALALAVHVLGAVVWVGGMFFAYVVLRPAASAVDLAIRLALWRGVFARFFVWVWASVTALLGSGFAMVALGFGGFRSLPLYVRVMMAVGFVMAAIYVWVYFVPWRRYRNTVAAQDWQAGGKNLNQIRRLVGLNLVLGLIVVVLAASGRYL